MRLLQVIAILCVALLELVKSDAIETEVHPDIGASLEFEAIQVLKRVEKIVRVTYPYSLNADSKTAPFPDMSVPVYIPFDQFVKINYNIVYLNKNGFFITFVKIDGKQNPDFRIATGDSRFHSHVISDEVWMAKGKHVIALQYQTNSCTCPMPVSYWSTATFKIKYLQP